MTPRDRDWMRWWDMMRHDETWWRRHDKTWWWHYDDIMKLSFLELGGTSATPFELAKGAAKGHVHRLGSAGIWPGQHWHDHTRTGRYKPELHCLSMSFIIILRNSIRFHTFALIVAILVNILSHLHLSLLFEAFSIRHRINGASKVPKPVYTLRSLLQKTWSLRWSHNPTMRSLISGKNMQWSYTGQFELQTIYKPCFYSKVVINAYGNLPTNYRGDCCWYVKQRDGMGCSSSIASSQGTSKHVAMMTCFEISPFIEKWGVRCGYICIYYHTSLSHHYSIFHSSPFTYHIITCNEIRSGLWKGHVIHVLVQSQKSALARGGPFW